MLRRLFFASLIVTLSATTTRSGHPSCTQCGCSQLRKVCVPVCEMIKETTFEYSCVCEDFCVPGPSKCVGHRCEPGCDGCPQCVKVMLPTCGAVYTRTKLLKTPVTKEKCVTKWVVKTICGGCNRECGSCTNGCGPNCTDCTTAAAPESASLLPPPTFDATAPAIPTPAEEKSNASTLPSRLFR